MSAVTFRLAGPMQAWSNTPAKAVRPTQDHPTKTGVIGMIASALGRDRTDPVDDLATLRFAVRADRPGELAEDYHTAGSGTFPILPGTILANPNLLRDAAKLPEGEVLDSFADGDYAAPAAVTEKAGGVLAPGRAGNTVIRTDQYLADAIFTVTLTGPRNTVDSVAAALIEPARPLHLGRKDYPPTGQLLIGVTDHDDPVEALAATDVDGRAAGQPWRVWTETPIDGQPPHYVADQPTNYATRRPAVRPEYITVATATDTTDNSSRGEVDFFTAPAADLTTTQATHSEQAQTSVDFFTAPQETQS